MVFDNFQGGLLKYESNLSNRQIASSFHYSPSPERFFKDHFRYRFYNEI